MRSLDLSQEDLARILGISVRTLGRWLKSEKPDLDERLSEIEPIIDEALQTLRPETVPHWIRLPLEPLGGLRPIDLLASPMGRQRIRALLAEIRWGTLG